MFEVCCLTHIPTCDSTTLAIYLFEMILFDPRLPMFDDNYQRQCYIIVTNVNSIIVLVNIDLSRASFPSNHKHQELIIMFDIC
ncbi:hypothetical protein BLOT_002653 [Blomia tropicalis]|nr:hypothetical protein BLOT_002653 [Blomia tropicalis]